MILALERARTLGGGSPYASGGTTSGRAPMSNGSGQLVDSSWHQAGTGQLSNTGAAPVASGALEVRSTSGPQDIISYSGSIYAARTVDSGGTHTVFATGGRYKFRTSANNHDLLDIHLSGNSLTYRATQPAYLYHESASGWGHIFQTGSAVSLYVLATWTAHNQQEMVWRELGITASSGQAQGGGQLTRDFNVITTCATAGNSVTLPAITAGAPAVYVNASRVIWVRNNGAEAAAVFPSSGHDLGAGTNASISLPAGETAIFIGISSTTWARIL